MTTFIARDHHYLITFVSKRVHGNPTQLVRSLSLSDDSLKSSTIKVVAATGLTWLQAFCHDGPCHV